jgi:hypothetical protein
MARGDGKPLGVPQGVPPAMLERALRQFFLSLAFSVA